MCIFTTRDCWVSQWKIPKRIKYTFFFFWLIPWEHVIILRGIVCKNVKKYIVQKRCFHRGLSMSVCAPDVVWSFTFFVSVFCHAASLRFDVWRTHSKSCASKKKKKKTGTSAALSAISPSYSERASTLNITLNAFQKKKSKIKPNSLV